MRTNTAPGRPARATPGANAMVDRQWPEPTPAVQSGPTRNALAWLAMRSPLMMPPTNERRTTADALEADAYGVAAAHLRTHGIDAQDLLDPAMAQELEESLRGVGDAERRRAIERAREVGRCRMPEALRMSERLLVRATTIVAKGDRDYPLGIQRRLGPRAPGWLYVRGNIDAMNATRADGPRGTATAPLRPCWIATPRTDVTAETRAGLLAAIARCEDEGWLPMVLHDNRIAAAWPPTAGPAWYVCADRIIDRVPGHPQGAVLSRNEPWASPSAKGTARTIELIASIADRCITVGETEADEAIGTGIRALRNTGRSAGPADPPSTTTGTE